MLVQDVQPTKGGAAQEAGAADEEASKPSTMAGIWKHVVDPSTGKVTDIYFMRQMSNDERYWKVSPNEHPIAENLSQPHVAGHM